MQKQSPHQGSLFVASLGFLFLCGSDLVSAQITAPTAGTIFAPNGLNKVHKGATGKPCLSLSGSAKAQIVNREMFDHIVRIANSCPQRINVNVCYYRTDHCVTVDVPPYERAETVLGVFPKLQDFRFEYKERF
jgi:hypothetical protein